MLSNQILTKTIREIHEILKVSCSVWTMEGRMAASEGTISKGTEKTVHAIVKEGENAELPKGFFFVRDEEEPKYVLAFEEGGEELATMGRLCVSQFEALIYAYKERLDRNRFFQNLLLDNLLLVDIYNQAKKLGIENEQRRAVFLVEPMHEEDTLVLETLKGLYATGTKDFVTSVDEGHIILVRGMEETEGYQDLEHVAKTLVDTLNMEAMVGVRVAYGTVVGELRDVSKSYKEASIALDVGRIFYMEKHIFGYNQLGIGRLIHQLPLSLCEMFLKEVFEGKALDQFDEETLSTVNSFFENNLNISETARKLYVHRNTLVYRLEKIQKSTGLDVRVFDDALTFKIAMMVTQHIRSVRESGL